MGKTLVKILFIYENRASGISPSMRDLGSPIVDPVRFLTAQVYRPGDSLKEDQNKNFQRDLMYSFSSNSDT